MIKLIKKLFDDTASVVALVIYMSEEDNNGVVFFLHLLKVLNWVNNGWIHLVCLSIHLSICRHNSMWTRF